MKSIEEFYHSDLLPDLEKLETRRLTVKNKLTQAIVIWVVLNLVFLFVAGRFGINVIFLLMFMTLSAILAFFPWHIKYYKEYRAGFKENIIPRIVAFIDMRLHYNKSGMVGTEEFNASHLFSDTPGEYHGDDLVSGTLGETAIRFSEVHAKRVDIIRQRTSSAGGTRKRVTPIFDGLFFVADFNKSFKGTTIVLPDTAQKLFGDLGQALQGFNVQNGQLIKLEDPEFEKLFVVYGQDQVEARYVLSTSLMRRLVNFQTRAHKKMRFSFSGSKLYVAIASENELFEPKIRESLLNISHVQEYYDDLKLVADIVDELNLNTRIWTTKGQTSTDSVASINAEAEVAGPETTPLPYSELGTKKRYTEAETRALFKDFTNAAEPKIKTAKRWIKRIAAVFLLLLCLPFLILGGYTPGLIMLGFGLFFLVGGFMGAGKEKPAGAVIFVAMGIMIALSAYSAYKTRVQSKTWPTVEGNIIRSEIEQYAGAGGEGTNAETTVQEYAKIAYQYLVDGRQYESDKISFSSSSKNAGQLVSRYPKGKTVRVYYNPDKPKQAVLVPGSAGINYAPYFFSGMFILLGMGMGSMSRKQNIALGKS
ncbi:MAG: DUF3137 domain-containing protein [Syntrophaceae bacterium]|nr:DUF3137 domain-containing protein [Syntrophaceae bacterium]